MAYLVLTLLTVLLILSNLRWFIAIGLIIYFIYNIGVNY